MNKLIYEYLDELFPNPHCELKYHKDYELLIAVMLSSQTTDIKVNKVTDILFKQYPTLKSLSQAEYKDIRDILLSLGMYNKKAEYVIKIALELTTKYQGKVLNDREVLEALPGVGRKVTNVVLGILFNEPYIAVDTHVKRIAIRLGIAEEKDNVYLIEKKLSKVVPDNLKVKIHFQFVLFGRYHCKAIKPNCSECKLKEICSYYKNKKSA